MFNEPIFLVLFYNHKIKSMYESLWVTQSDENAQILQSNIVDFPVHLKNNSLFPPHIFSLFHSHLCVLTLEFSFMLINSFLHQPRCSGSTGAL